MLHLGRLELQKVACSKSQEENIPVMRCCALLMWNLT